MKIGKLEKVIIAVLTDSDKLNKDEIKAEVKNYDAGYSAHRNSIFRSLKSLKEKRMIVEDNGIYKLK